MTSNKHITLLVAVAFNVVVHCILLEQPEKLFIVLDGPLTFQVALMSNNGKEGLQVSWKVLRGLYDQ